jgi:hypothetical protein
MTDHQSRESVKDMTNYNPSPISPPNLDTLEDQVIWFDRIERAISKARISAGRSGDNQFEEELHVIQCEIGHVMTAQKTNIELVNRELRNLTSEDQ